MAAVNLGTTRIVIVAALILVGVVIVADDSGAPTTDTTPPTSGTTGSTGPTGATGESPEPPPPEGQIEGVTFAVFNGTDQVGFAADVTIVLKDAGYTAAQDAGDAPTSGTRRTTVYFRGGAHAAQNESNARLLADSHLSGAKVTKLNPEFADLVTKQTQLVILLGADQLKG